MAIPESFTVWSVLAALLQLLIVLSVIVRVMLTRHPPGSAFAWILLTTILPYFGFLLYLAFGERPIGRLRAKRLKAAIERWGQLSQHKLTPLGPLPRHLARHRTLLRLAAKLAGMPLATGSSALLKAPRKPSNPSIRTSRQRANPSTWSSTSGKTAARFGK